MQRESFGDAVSDEMAGTLLQRAVINTKALADGWVKWAIPTMSIPYEDSGFPVGPVGLVGSAW